MNKEVANNIKRLRTQRGMTQQELGDKIGVGKTTISEWEKGNKMPNAGNIEKISMYFDVAKSVLFMSQKEIDAMKEAKFISGKSNHVRNIPLMGIITPNDIFRKENVRGMIPVLAPILKEEKDYFYLKVNDDSMNLEFTEGSYVLVEIDRDVRNNQIAVVVVDGKTTIKKVIKTESTIALIPQSTNSDHQPMMYDLNNNDVNVIGRVVQSMKMY